MSTPVMIEADGLCKQFGSFLAVRDVSFSIPKGQVVAFLGPNGAGKTTTVRILATLTRADAGRARVAGHDVERERRRVRRGISLAGQYAAVDGLQTGAENLRMMGRLSGLSPVQARRRAADLLDQFGLAAAGNRRVGTYSGGMRRRLDLAASLTGTPSVIFLDEPTTGLDLPSRQALWQVVGGLAEMGVTVFLTTQYLEEADLLASRVAVIDGGRVVAEGSPGDLKRLIAGQRLDLVLADGAAFDAVTRLAGDRAVAADPAGLTIGVATGGSAGEVRALLDEFDPDRSAVRSFSVHSTTLDDVFLALTSRTAGRPETEPSRV
jgi:ABC-2 type transport system ATP-binding protein